MKSEIAARMPFDQLRYAQVWEDIRLLYAGLDVQPDDDILSITSAGDNVLGLLLKGPRSITAVDLSPCQSALLALKLAACQTLTHDEFVALVGLRPHPDRTALYERCRPALPSWAQRYWDEAEASVTAGIAWSGRLERYFLEWQDVLHRHVSADEMAGALRLDDPDAQRIFFADHLATPGFEADFRWYFGEKMMADRGRDPAQFAYVAVDAGAHFWTRFSHAFQTLPLRDNFYLQGFLAGTYPELGRCHPYLQPSNFERLGRLAGRVDIVTGALEAVVQGSAVGTFSKANLSDLFEYVSEEHTVQLLSELSRAFRPGGRIAYWSLLVDRSLPAACARLFDDDAATAGALWLKDRSWFYRSFHILHARAG